MLYISQIIFISAISSETPGYCEVNFRDAIICFQMRKQDQRGKRLAEGDKKKKKKNFGRGYIFGLEEKKKL